VVSAGEKISFNLTLYSLAREIDRVEIIAEAHRLIEATPSE
jgi:hypothetical protein